MAEHEIPPAPVAMPNAVPIGESRKSKSETVRITASVVTSPRRRWIRPRERSSSYANLRIQGKTPWEYNVETPTAERTTKPFYTDDDLCSIMETYYAEAAAYDKQIYDGTLVSSDAPSTPILMLPNAACTINYEIISSQTGSARKGTINNPDNGHVYDNRDLLQIGNAHLTMTQFAALIQRDSATNTTLSGFSNGGNNVSGCQSFSQIELCMQLRRKQLSAIKFDNGVPKYVIAAQSPRVQNWVFNFHTGFNIALEKLNQDHEYRCKYLPRTFAGLHLMYINCATPGACVAVFETGSVNMTGPNQPELMFNIMMDLHKFLAKYKINAVPALPSERQIARIERYASIDGKRAPGLDLSDICSAI